MIVLTQLSVYIFHYHLSAVLIVFESDLPHKRRAKLSKKSMFISEKTFSRIFVKLQKPKFLTVHT